jgi:hypothetical protein
MPRNLAQVLDRIPYADLSHDDLTALCLSVLSELSVENGTTAAAKVRAVEVLLRIQQDRRAAEGGDGSPGELLMALLKTRGTDD